MRPPLLTTLRPSAVSLVLLLLAGGEARSDEPAPAAPPDHPRWGISAALSTGTAGGAFGDLFREPIGGDFNLFRNGKRWRYGFGLSFGSFDMKDPYTEEPEWGFQQTYLFATRMFGDQGRRVRPYLQGRVGLARLHPRSELFAFQPPPEEPGDSPTHPSNGFSLGVLPGVEVNLNDSLALDVSGSYTYFSVSDYELGPVALPPTGSGSAWEVRLGLRWHPDNGWPSGPPGPGHPEEARDAWGVSKNLGWGAAEALAINWVASGVNEYVRSANFNQISPRSWWHNIEEGFTFDDNQFRTNQRIHPINGSTYFNAGRANGFGFWESSAFAVAGAFFWECCGETHPMSYNDMVSTGIGGMALGEMSYRLTSQLLDNTATNNRIWREIGATLINPIRGVNRWFSGRATRVHANPTEPLDWRPKEARFFVFAGARMIGEGDSISNNTKTYGFVAFDHAFGSVFDNPRRKPFDSFNMTTQLSVGEKQPITIARVRGDLYSRPIGSGEDPRYAFAIVQHYDYYNNLAYEFGQQAFGPSFFARYRLSDRLALRLRADALVSILAAVNSDYSFLADVGDRERFREYDYGPGLGAAVEANLTRNGRNLLTLSYRYQWIDVSNGSIFNKEDERGLEGSDAKHQIEAFGLRAVAPVYKRLGLGVDAFYFLRQSEYDAVFLQDQDQRNPEVRAYLSLELGG
jgi:opacity protein-like surface antigen